MSIWNHTKSYKNILIYYIGYMTPKTLCLIIGNAKGYIEKSAENKTCVESKDMLKKYRKM